MTVLSEVDRARVQRRTVFVLASATMLGGLGVGASLSVGALLLAEVSGSDAISGLGSAVFNAGTAAAGIPLARVSARYGRRLALVLGSIVAMLGAIVAVIGAEIGVWGVVALGIAMVGVASTVQLLSRFAATDLALPATRARDLSLVVWSITVGAVIGPNLLAPGSYIGSLLGVTPLAGVFVFPLIAQGLAALVNGVGLRPDPLLSARVLQQHDAADLMAAREPSTQARELRTHTDGDTTTSSTRPQPLIIAAIALAQAIMVALMAMTPLHLVQHGGTAELVGFTLSLHIAGMFALSPLVGVLAGQWGGNRVIALGHAVLLVSIVIVVAAGSSYLLIQISLTLLGIGWCLVTVAGAALLTELTAVEQRPMWQGRSDAIMSGAGALAGALAGIVFAFGGFSGLAIASAGLLAIGIFVSVRLRAVSSSLTTATARSRMGGDVSSA